MESILTDSCVNCCSRFSKENCKVVSFHSSAKFEKIDIPEAIEYIFDISLQDLNTYQQYSKEDESLSAECIVLCSRCAYELSNVYHSISKFQKLANDLSLMSKLIQWKKDQRNSEYDPHWDTISREKTAFPRRKLIVVTARNHLVGNHRISHPGNEALAVIKSQSENIRSLKQKMNEPACYTELKSRDSTNSGVGEDNGRDDVKPTKSAKIIASLAKANPFECKICSICVNSQDEFVDHRRFHPPECPFCGQSFIDVAAFKAHVLVHGKKNGNPGVCADCKKVFTDFSDIMNHSCQSRAPYPCGKCPTEFYTIAAVESHICNINISSGDFVCKRCGKKFASLRNLENHTQIHITKPFWCVKCDRIFKSLENLNEHIRLHTSAPEESHDCYICLKKYETKKKLLDHLRSHAPDCPYCSQSFLEASEFRTHVLTHQNEKMKPDAACSICEKKYIDFNDILTHNRHTRIRKPPFNCVACSMGFYDKNSLRKHELTHKDNDIEENTLPNTETELEDTTEIDIFESSDPEPLQDLQTGKHNLDPAQTITLPSCPVCLEPIIGIREFKSHLTSHREKNEVPGVCSDCNREYSDFTDVLKHTCNVRDPYACPYCPIPIYSIHFFEEHILTHTGYECPTCTKVFKDKDALIKHKEEHIRNPFWCTQCGKCYEVQDLLTAHYRNHKDKDEPPYNCATCGLSFILKLRLKDHEKAHEQPQSQAVEPNKQYLCKECEKRFPSSLSLKTHMRLHDGHIEDIIIEADSRGRYVCDICSYSFSKRHKLRNHIRVHTGEKPFKCNFCDKIFAKKFSAKCHERLHKGEKHFACSFCEERFQHREQLKKHVRTHTGEPPPYACRFCDKRFDRFYYLKLHETTHTKVRPFLCVQCGKSFSTQPILTKHEQGHEIKHECTVCNRTFKYDVGLRRHKKVAKH